MPSLRSSLLLVLLAGSALAGCSQRYRVDPILYEDKEIHGFESRSSSSVIGSPPILVLNPKTYGLNVSATEAPKWVALYDIAMGVRDRSGNSATTTSPTDEDRRTARNDLVDAIVRASNETVAVHHSGIRATETSSNLLLGATAIGLSSGAGVAATEAAKALAIASSGVQGARALVNEQVYRNALSESVIALMENDRQLTLQQIRDKYPLHISAYGVEQAITDAAQYHEKGSFYHGMALLREAADDKIKQIKSLLGTEKAGESQALDTRARRIENDIRALTTELAIQTGLRDANTSPQVKQQAGEAIARLTPQLTAKQSELEQIRVAQASIDAALLKARADAAKALVDSLTKSPSSSTAASGAPPAPVAPATGPMVPVPPKPN